MLSSARGSLWHKWDFHVHTPYSVLNNQFHIDPSKTELDENDNRVPCFDRYVYELFTKAIEKGVAAIGITDYFCIDGYKRIREEYLEDDAALERVFKDEDIRSKVRDILVFPNIEFRTDDFFGNRSHALNYHVIFSSGIPAETIERLFLQQLHFVTGTQQTLPLSRETLETYGRDSAEVRGDGREDYYRLGLELVTVNRAEVLKLLRDTDVFRNSYLIAASVDEDLSRVDWYGRDYTTRREIYHECDCLLTSSEGTRKWALAKGEERERIAEIGGIKPCIWGSDAHDVAHLFEPEGQKYCWIKSDVTFEGLRQITMEPELRVRIQRDMPAGPDSHKVIDCLRVHHSKQPKGQMPVFQSAPVLFNEGLTCIIGGKSTGKSLLLRTLAHAIDSDYARAQENAAGVLGSLPSTLDAEVVWGDGVSGSRRFIYIPQAYLNRLTDDPEKRTKTDDLIEGILLQDPSRKKAFDNKNALLKTLRGKRFVLINEYMSLAGELDRLQDLLRADGKADMYAAGVKKLEAERDSIALKEKVSDAEVAEYEQLRVTLEQLNGDRRRLMADYAIIDDMENPAVVVPGYCSIQDGFLVHDFSALSDFSENRMKKVMEDEKRAVAASWSAARHAILSEIDAELADIDAKIEEAGASLEHLKEKVENSENLRSITERIAEERRRQDVARGREADVKQIIEQMTQKKLDLFHLREEIADTLEGYCDIINESVVRGTALEFEARPIWRKEEFVELLLSQIDKRGLQRFKQVYGVDIQEADEETCNNRLIENIWHALERQTELGGLKMRQGVTLDRVLTSLFDDWYNVHYVVRSGNDEMDSMSPGKKCLVMLELIIDLDNELCPLLIDQPEDDLDNRSVYQELVAYLRKRKPQRQIIVVTHNANVVLGTDAEEVIIANQHGVDTPNYTSRFEYRTGAIENDEAVASRSKGILYERGMQAQMCDILEGGPEALARRRKKYTSRSLVWQ